MTRVDVFKFVAINVIGRSPTLPTNLRFLDWDAEHVASLPSARGSGQREHGLHTRALTGVLHK